jgi:hypothetical protein
MKKAILIVLMMCTFGGVWAQQSDSSAWSGSAEGMFYFFQGGESIFLPVLRADYKKLHLEARYNYEDIETFSGWVGYNLEGGGDKVSYLFTPMAGVAGGLTKGFAAGLEFTVSVGKFELYSESEYLWDRAGSEYNFFYIWTDLTYSPRDWWWIGISGQRTRLYQTETDVQRGLVLGASKGNWEFSGYAYNLGMSEPFLLIDVTFTF